MVKPILLTPVILWTLRTMTFTRSTTQTLSLVKRMKKGRVKKKLTIFWDRCLYYKRLRRTGSKLIIRWVMYLEWIRLRESSQIYWMANKVVRRLYFLLLTSPFQILYLVIETVTGQISLGLEYKISNLNNLYNCIERLSQRLTQLLLILMMRW